MPARTSSPMPARLGQAALPNLRVTRWEAADPRRFLIWVPDPRGLRGTDPAGARSPAMALWGCFQTICGALEPLGTTETFEY